MPSVELCEKLTQIIFYITLKTLIMGDSVWRRLARWN